MMKNNFTTSTIEVFLIINSTKALELIKILIGD